MSTAIGTTTPRQKETLDMRTYTIAAFGAVLALAACSAPTPPPPVAQIETIRFTAEFGGTPFACGKSYRLGTPPVAAMPTDLRFYVTGVELLRADGSAVPFMLAGDTTWQGQGVALLDFEDGTGPCAAGGSSATNTTLRGTAPAGDYTGLRFVLGVPAAVNHQDAAIASEPLNVTAMFWNWQNGYKFLKADFNVSGRPMAKPAAGHVDSSGFALHLGSTQCASAGPTQPGTDCKNPNRPTITLSGFNPLRDTVVVDLAPVLQRADLRRNTPKTPAGCMSFPGDPECRVVLPPMGVPYADVPAGQQRLFTARAATKPAQ